MEFTAHDVLGFMRGRAYLFVDAQTGETNLTELAEDAAGYFHQNHKGGCLDDPDHWIWELAARFAKS